MKKNNLIISSGAVLVAIMAISGIVFVSQAAEKTVGVGAGRGSEMGRGNGPARIELSEEERAEWEANREERRAEQGEKREEIEKIFQNNDYQAWLEQMPENCPMKDKVNADNFDRFAEAHRLQSQGRKILEEEFGFTGQGIGRGMTSKGKGMGNGGFHRIAE